MSEVFVDIKLESPSDADSKLINMIEDNVAYYTKKCEEVLATNLYDVANK